MKIEQFKGEYRFLSNFYPVEILLDLIYPSVEAAYMSAKNDSPEWKAFCADTNNTPGQIKRASRGIILVDGWESCKLLVVEECLRQKFKKPYFKGRLLKTYPNEIVEGNNWGDTFWGVSLKTGEGENNLGKLLMKIRQELVDSK